MSCQTENARREEFVLEFKISAEVYWLFEKQLQDRENHNLENNWLFWSVIYIQKIIRSCKQLAEICIFCFFEYDFKPFVFSSRTVAFTTISWQSDFLMLYDQKLQNWKYTWVDLFCMFNFLCTQKYLKNHFVLKVNRSKPSIKNYLVSGCEYSRLFQRFCQRKHVGEVSGNVLWGSSKSDGHIISPHNYSNVFENYQLGILSWYNTKFSKLESKTLWAVSMGY